MAPIIKVAFFDAKGYDKISFEECMKDADLGGLEIEFLYLEPRLSLSTVQFARGCDAVVGFVNDDISAEVIAALDEFEIPLICMRCAGFDGVDLAACGELGIAVTRVPAYSPYAVAEFAATLLMTLNRKTHKAYNRVRDGNFTLSGLVGFDVKGKTVGVVGTGKIGQCFIDIMIGFGAKILAYDVYINEVYKAKPEVTYVTMDELLAKSDIISLHTPLLPTTKHLINRHSINKMKTGVVLINTSRGGLIDSRALVEGLIAGRIGGAGLDVYENEAKYFFRDVSDEDIDDDVMARLQNMRNVLFTSHQAFLTREALEAISRTTLLNLKEYFVNKKRLDQLTNFVPPPAKANPAVEKALIRRASQEMDGVIRRGSSDTLSKH